MASLATVHAPNTRAPQSHRPAPIPSLPRVLAGLLDGSLAVFTFDDAAAGRMAAVQVGIAHAVAMDCLRRTTSDGAGAPAGGPVDRAAELGGATRLMAAGARIMDARHRLRGRRGAQGEPPRGGSADAPGWIGPVRVMWLPETALPDPAPAGPAVPRPADGPPTRCGARTRRGTPCRASAVAGQHRCRMHGGAVGTGAPRGNRNAWTGGRHSGAALARKAEIRRHWRGCTATAALVETLCRLDPGAGAEIALVPGRGAAPVPLWLWRDGRGLCHLARTRPGAATGGRMGLIRENGEGAARASLQGHDCGREARAGTAVPHRVPEVSAPARMGLFRENGETALRPALRGHDHGRGARPAATVPHRVPVGSSPAPRMGLFRETGETAPRPALRGHDHGREARPGTAVPHPVPGVSAPAPRMGLIREMTALLRCTTALHPVAAVPPFVPGPAGGRSEKIANRPGRGGRRQAQATA